MTMTIIATYEATNAQELTEIIDMIRGGEPTTMTINGTLEFDYSDLTPAHGIVRIDERMNAAVNHYVTALVMWTREHITEGPVAKTSDAQLRCAYRDLQAYGLDSDIGDSCDLTTAQASCIRGAFRDATAGMVPI